MADSEARFAAKLARSVGRLDWWNVRDEHSPYEWALQKALFAVEPWGEDRADLRAAVNTQQIVAAHGVALDEDDFAKLRFYLKVNSPKQVLSPAQQRQLIEG